MLRIEFLAVLSLAFCVTVKGNSSGLTYCPQECGVFPLSSSNCTEYIVCKHGIGYHMICPKGLAYNPDKKSCDLKENVKCNPEKKTPSRDVPTSKKGTSNDCPKQNGTFPLSCGGCSKYVLCVSGHPTYLECPPGLSYDYKKCSCDWSHNVACDRTPAQSKAPCPAAMLASTRGQAPGYLVDYDCRQSNDYSAVQDNCHSYIVCQENVAYKAFCPPGHKFNSKARWPESACTYAPRAKCGNAAVKDIGSSEESDSDDMESWW